MSQTSKAKRGILGVIDSKVVALWVYVTERHRSQPYNLVTRRGAADRVIPRLGLLLVSVSVSLVRPSPSLVYFCLVTVREVIIKPGILTCGLVFSGGAIFMSSVLNNGMGSGSALDPVILRVAVVATIFATLVSATTILMHLKNYRRPMLQR